MAIDPNYIIKSTSEITVSGVKNATVAVRAASATYPSDLTYCSLPGVRYEVDHIDGNGKPRTPDEVAAILKQLMYDGGHAVDPNPKLSSTESAPESQPMKTDI